MAEPMTTLLSEEHPITEKGMMEFQPFGVEPDGTKIQDLSGVAMRAMFEYLEEYASRSQGPDAGWRAVEELVQRLNERIPDRAFHVTSKFLRTPVEWLFQRVLGVRWPIVQGYFWRSAVSFQLCERKSNLAHHSNIRSAFLSSDDL